MTADTALFFDLDGTLVQFTRPYDEVLADTFEAHLGEAGDDLVAVYDEAFYGAFYDFVPDPYRRGMTAVVEAAGADADPDALVATLREAEYAMTATDASLPDSIASLSENATLGVLTNGVTDWQVGKLERHGLADHFDAVVASYEAGAHKPDPAIFERAAERLPAEEYAMVGDDDADVEGARDAGWVPIRYEDGEEGPAFWETVGALL